MKFATKNISLNARFQLLLIEIYFTVFWDMALLSNYSDKSNLFIVILGTIILNTLLLVNLYFILLVHKCKFSIKDSLKRNIGFFIVLIAFFFCFLTIIRSWLNLDGYIYYNELRNLKNWNFSSFSSLMLAGHCSQGYTIFLLIGEFLSPDNVLGVRTVHFVLCSITIYCFYGIIRHTLSNAKKYEITLYTAIFAMSPMLLGMSSEINTDFPLLCFLVWMFYCFLEKKYILQAFCALLLCFSKETGCLLYAFYLLGILLGRFINIKKEKVSVAIKKFFSKDIIGMILSGCIWIGNFFISGRYGWMDKTNISSQTNNMDVLGIKLNSIAFFPEYIFQKLKQMLFINFNWILYAFILLLICNIIFEGIKRIKGKVTIDKESIFALIFSFSAFLFYNFVYITYNHYRYLIPFLFFICFTAVLSIFVFFDKAIIKTVISSVIIILFTLSNFLTIDPVSQLLFLQEGTGRGIILIPSTITVDSNENVILHGTDSYSSVIINNSGMYNFQSAQLGICFDKTLKSISYDDDTLIVMPAEYRDDYGTRASIFGINLAKIYDIYWDTEKKQTNINCAEKIEIMKHNKRYKKLNLYITDDLDTLTAKVRKKYKRIYYIALPFDKNFNHKEFLGNIAEKYEDTLQYFSWKWNLYRIK